MRNASYLWFIVTAGSLSSACGGDTINTVPDNGAGDSAAGNGGGSGSSGSELGGNAGSEVGGNGSEAAGSGGGAGTVAAGAGGSTEAGKVGDSGVESEKGDSAASDASDATTLVPPSCLGLATTCGPGGNGSCCVANVVTGGTYNRGNDANYPATVSDFRLDKYDVTVGRFRKFVSAYSPTMVAAGAGKNPNNTSDSGWDAAWNASLPANAAALTTAVKCHATYQTWTDGAGGNESRPMSCLNWYEAYAFCIWDGGRLPTEAEWNYAAAGGNEQRQYPWGATVPGANASLAVYGCLYNGTGTCTGMNNIAPVGSVSAGDGKWGQSDLAGSVWQWTEDWYASPYADPCNNCSNFTPDTQRVIRGGSFDTIASNLLSAFRNVGAPSYHSYNVGARCSRSAP